MHSPILWPAIAMVALTAVVWMRMYVVRLREMWIKGIRPQAVASSRDAAVLLEDTRASDNLRNLFEVPVLFFAVCLALAVTDAVTPLQLFLAWAFVVLRAAHSGIHLSHNRVALRFGVHVLGTMVVFSMWLLFALELAAFR